MPDGSIKTFRIEGRLKPSQQPYQPADPQDALGDGYQRAQRDFETEADSCVRAAQKAIRIGREGKVLRLLTSNGVAPSNQATADTLRAMHPKATKELVLPEPTGPQLTTSTEACADRTKASAGSISAPIDLFGYSNEALCHDRGHN